MPYQPTSRPTVTFPPREWELLVRLPGRVLVAATSAQPDSARHTVAEGLAGIEAIAAGRASPSQLVRDVVTAVYAEQLADDAQEGIARVLAECRAATRTLAATASRADADAYRWWLIDIAVTVCAAARAGGLFGLGGERISASEAKFLDDLSQALTL
jgi:hypothetical protein